ncbi:hypothetical protein DDB_G0268816 [Dictyostelium discoideum AX4]|uniref:WWE domain-containing protein n=1 Tax=Dictyostelium discoideum TaxID=44689 RepID=Q55EN3_DICDI|nr:hypothetical protein DDB_G0268816 [Dictyostelium discoideum AX4]EAL72997.1 hypothetical protein DDB_G0268816 [Dictyostelium discoideum AX4]|eukprot:XP_646987.1 hypothetical protein DDB_G0268816 [Dictyostelium discoideum AX4]
MEPIEETSIQTEKSVELTQEKDTSTTTTTTTKTTTTKTTSNKEIKKNIISLTTTTTRGQKRAKITFDYLFGNIINSKDDIQTLIGYEFVGPTEKELSVCFEQFPKQSTSVITTQDLTNYLKNNYTTDQLNKVTPPINVDNILESADLNESGSIELDDFVDYIKEKIIEESISLGLIIEIEDEEPKKRVRKPPVVAVVKAKKQPKAEKLKKKSKVEKVSKKVSKKEIATKGVKTPKSPIKSPKKTTTKTLKTVKPKKSNLKYNFEKNTTTTTSSTELNNQLEGNNLSGEGKMIPKWQYKFSNNWMDYTEAASAITEQAYQDWLLNSFIDVRSVQSGQWCYQIDFKQMTQTNIQHHDHTSRQIRRIVQNV